MTGMVGSDRVDRCRLSTALPMAVVCGALALLLWPVLFGDQTLFYRDLYLQYIGTGRLLHTGDFLGGLTWDPFLNGGQPLLGNPNQFVLYPSRILYLVMSPASGLNWEIALHLLLGAAGTVVLARRLGVSRAGSAVAGLSFCLSGLSISIVSHLGRLMAYNWVPWILLAVHAGLCERGKNSWRWQLSIPWLFTAQWLTGTAESVALTAVMAIGWVGTLHLRHARRHRVLIRSSGLVALGVAMAAIQIFPSAEMVYRSDRLSYAQIGASVDWSLHPLRLPEMVIPGYLGPIDEVYGGRHYWGTGLFNRGFPLIVSLYLGISVAFLALVGWMRSRSDPMWSALRIFFALLAGGAVVIAFGEYLPLVGDAWATIPGFNVLRFPVKVLLVLGLPVALLAGHGIDAWLRCDHRTAQRTGLGALAAAFLLLAIAGWVSLNQSVPTLDLLFPDRGEMAADGLPGRLVHVALVLAALSLVGLVSGRAGKWLLSMLAVAVVAADLFVASIPFLPMAPRRLLDDTPHMVEEIRNQLSVGRFYRDPDPPGVDYPYVEDRAWEGTEWLLRDLTYSVASTFMVPMVFNFDIAGLADRRMAHLELATGEAEWSGRIKLFQTAAVEVILTREPPGVPGLDLVGAYGIADSLPLFLYRVNPTPAMARWVSSERRVASAQDALEMLVAPDFDPTAAVVREFDAPTTRLRTPFLMLLHPQTEIWRQVITAPKMGFVVTAVPWHPDLVTRVNGRIVRAERVNYAFSGFTVPAGCHDVQMTFVSRTVFFGGLVSGISAAIWGALVFGMWWSKRQGSPHESNESPRASSPRSA